VIRGSTNINFSSQAATKREAHRFQFHFGRRRISDFKALLAFQLASGYHAAQRSGDGSGRDLGVAAKSAEEKARSGGWRRKACAQPFFR